MPGIQKVLRRKLSLEQMKTKQPAGDLKSEVPEEEKEKARSWEQTQRTRPKQDHESKEPGKIENPKKSTLSDLILQKKEKAITVRRHVQVCTEQCLQDSVHRTGCCLLSATWRFLISATSLIKKQNTTHTSLLNVLGMHFKSSLPQGGCDIKAGKRPRGEVKTDSASAL